MQFSTNDDDDSGNDWTERSPSSNNNMKCLNRSRHSPHLMTRKFITALTRARSFTPLEPD